MSSRSFIRSNDQRAPAYGVARVTYLESVVYHLRGMVTNRLRTPTDMVDPVDTVSGFLAAQRIAHDLGACQRMVSVSS